MNELQHAIPIKTLELKPLPDWLELREVQKVMFSNLIKSYRAGFRRQAVMASTGSGKSIWAAVLFHRILSKKINSKLIFIVPRNTLIDQIYKTFIEILQIPISVIQGQDDRIDLSLPVQIATIQTLGNRIKRYPDLFTGYDLAVIDESHIQFDARELIEAEWIVALTATPYSKGMGLFYDDLVKSIPARELVDNGIITPIKVLSAQRQIDTSKLSVTSTGEYNSQEEEEETIRIVGDVLKEYENSEDMKGRPFIGFAKTITSCIGLSDEFTKSGHKVAYVHSKMSDDDCKAILDSFKAGDLIGVFSVVKLIEGFDFPEASAMLLCTSFAASKDSPWEPNALGRWIQMFGRVRRSVKNNPEKYALIHDHGENYVKFGHPDVFELGFDELCTKKKKEVDTEKTEKDLKPKVCPKCNYYIERGPECPNCGHILEKYSKILEGKIVEFVNGKMVVSESMEYERKNKNPNKNYSNDEKKMFFGGLKGYARDHGYSQGWCAHKYKEKFGVWPNAYKNALACLPNKEVSNFIKMGQIIYRAKQKKAGQ